MNEHSSQPQSKEEKVITVRSAVNFDVVGNNIQDIANFAIEKHEFKSATTLSAEEREAVIAKAKEALWAFVEELKVAAQEGPRHHVRSSGQGDPGSRWQEIVSPAHPDCGERRILQGLNSLTGRPWPSRFRCMKYRSSLAGRQRSTSGLRPPPPHRAALHLAAPPAPGWERGAMVVQDAPPSQTVIDKGTSSLERHGARLSEIRRGVR